MFRKVLIFTMHVGIDFNLLRCGNSQCCDFGFQKDRNFLHRSTKIPNQISVGMDHARHHNRVAFGQLSCPCTVLKPLGGHQSHQDFPRNCELTFKKVAVDLR